MDVLMNGLIACEDGLIYDIGSLLCSTFSTRARLWPNGREGSLCGHANKWVRLLCLRDLAGLVYG